MRAKLVGILLALWGGIALPSASALVRDLSFEERVRAQEAIERVYYSHQIGASRPFEAVFPRPILEAKVRTYLNHSGAQSVEATRTNLRTRARSMLHAIKSGARVRRAADPWSAH